MLPGRVTSDTCAFTSRSVYGSLSRMGIATEASRPGAVSGAGSPVLDRARGLGLSVPLDLERLAIARGCEYYERQLDLRHSPLDEVPLSNAELAVALINPSLNPQAREIRLAAALLGAVKDSAADVAALAQEEKCVEVVRYIASCGHHFEPGNAFWRALLDSLPDLRIDVEHLPHPTRFVEMTGIDRGKVGVFTRWIRARTRLSA